MASGRGPRPSLVRPDEEEASLRVEALFRPLLPVPVDGCWTGPPFIKLLDPEEELGVWVWLWYLPLARVTTGVLGAWFDAMLEGRTNAMPSGQGPWSTETTVDSIY